MAGSKNPNANLAEAVRLFELAAIYADDGGIGDALRCSGEAVRFLKVEQERRKALLGEAAKPVRKKAARGPR